MPAVPQPIHCVIVDDHLMLLQLLAGIVRSVPGLVVVSTATSVGQSQAVAALERIDLILVDPKLGAGDGMDFLRAVVAKHPNVKCIVLSGAAAEFVCPADLMANVVSVVDKSHACDTLLAEIAKAVGTEESAAPIRLSAAEIKSRLTGREFELFTVLGEGLANKEIGQRFGISTRTVETHRKSISKKLGCSGAALVRLAAVHHQIGGGPGLGPMQAVDASAAAGNQQ